MCLPGQIKSYNEGGRKKTKIALLYLILWILEVICNFDFWNCNTLNYITFKDKKAECANSLQWLRGKMEDIGQEYAELADSVMINGAPPGTSHFQILQDR